ncbi:hypothetical protein HBI56_119550 [Parastagonospora nodorum]|uniref:Uncharacterized protein n=1 Tax=Phaeosphaeria nodorum (strain SN15 / ATCC MYA-4574 / FGSC 10173) TaxID=321614 RepID=A0A7U2FC89_PHANO|nr:hypothetical protein HBH56_055220 [Parastagonospora nodorum]QRD02383.1 hypothetical protein JI435_440770 [Parastagonospora nodorum SN15]KAH3935693.1 hypothetical protein HBH54_041020 [Parastagonospora nodorum]KAH3948632.1 hypothetical protein HBH53_098290 [Parastagonospora nodorum]KAH3969836.1 hypothetical protein HBH51_121160 [Parastagonospora nodorum]
MTLAATKKSLPIALNRHIGMLCLSSRCVTSQRPPHASVKDNNLALKRCVVAHSSSDNAGRLRLGLLR